MALNPILQSGGGGYERPVDLGPTAIEGVADVIGSFLKAQPSQGSTKGPTEADIDRESLDWYRTELEVANAQRYQQGNESAASITERNAKKVLATRGIDPNTGPASAITESVTGRKAATVGFSPMELAAMEYREHEHYTPYMTAALAKNPDWTEEQAEQHTFNMITKESVLFGDIKQAQWDWTTSSRDAYTQTIDNFRDVNQGLLLAQGSWDSKAVLGAELEWSNLKSSLTRPQGASDEDWKIIDDKIKAIDSQFALAKAYGDSRYEGFTAETKLAAINMMESSGATTSDRIMLETALKSPDLLSVLQQDPNGLKNVTDLFKMMDNSDPSFEASLVMENEEGTAFNTNTLSKVRGYSSQEKVSAATGGFAIAGSASAPSSFKSDPQSANVWYKEFTTASAAFREFTTQEAPEWVTAATVDKLWSPQLIANMKELQGTNPAMFGEVATKALDSLGTVRTSMVAQLEKMAAGTYFKYDRANGKFSLDETKMAEVPYIKEAVDKFYGGDVEALMKDKGMRIKRATLGVGPNRSAYVFSQTNEQQRFEYIYNSINDLFMNDAPATALSQAQAVRAIDTKYSAILGIAQEGMQQGQQQAPEEASNGIYRSEKNSSPTQEYASGDFLANSMTQQAMDRHEGGGAYNTLFGHSQNAGKQFAGVDVTQMTLAQALDFASPSGQYGQWVKGQVGRVATPMGRFQFVGSTLREVAKEMGLDLNTTKFDEGTQNAMFSHYANKVVGGKSGATARSALRSAWEGFKNVSDSDLDTIIGEIKSGKPLFGPSNFSISGDGSAVNLGVVSASASPNQLSMATQPVGASQVASPYTLGREVSVDTAASPEVSQGSPEAAAAVSQGNLETGSSVSAKTEAAKLSQRSQEILGRLGISSGEVPSFNSLREAMKADSEGKINGDYVIIDGEVVKL